jgi:predicted ribosomally synthesized peptide with nif11-like leader
MANEALATFFDRLAKDDVIRDAYAASLKRAVEGAMLETARSAGLEFTVEELREALEERASELSEDQLDKVAGGVGIFAAPVPGDYDRGIGQYESFHPSGTYGKR